MAFDKAALAKLGGTEQHKTEFRAHFQFRGEKSTKINIRGPSRSIEEEAQKDLEQIRAAGSVAQSRQDRR